MKLNIQTIDLARWKMGKIEDLESIVSGTVHSGPTDWSTSRITVYRICTMTCVRNG